MELTYNKPIGLSALPQFNGNISSIKWATKSQTGNKGYTFVYDSVNRLRQAVYNEYANAAWNANNTYSEKNIRYDENGNILNLQRYGQLAPNKNPGITDNLTYIYKGNSNTLIAVNDAITGSNYSDFTDNGIITPTPDVNNNNTWEYKYDPNGNLTSDKNKGIIDITYNYQNLPLVVSFGNNNRIEYLYDAAGTKLRKSVYTSGALSTTTDYIGAFVYENNNPAYMLFDEGRMVFLGRTLITTEYYVKDHLGNIRVAFNPSDNEIRQVNSYYPFGASISGLTATNNANTGKNKYLYNGKEIQDEFGLNWYDYGARFYDPVTSRFLSVDPLADETPNWSPYTYALNNPIVMIDPDGRSADWYENENKEVVWDDHVTDQANTPKGGTYIGAKNSDILDYYGLSYKTSTLSTNRIGFMVLDESKEGSAYHSINVKSESKLTIDAKVGFSSDAITENNTLGKQFIGISFKVTNIATNSGTSEGTVEAGGRMMVNYGGIEYYGGLKSPSNNGIPISADRTTHTQAKVMIPGSVISTNKTLNNIDVNGSWGARRSEGYSPVVLHGLIPIPRTYFHRWTFK